jgi:hypothetical protein
VFLPDSPVKAVRFTETEKIAALLRVKENQSGTQNARVKKAQIIEPLRDIRVWLVASGPNKPYKKPGLAYRPGQAEGVGLDW